MPATVIVNRFTGAPPGTKTAITSTVNRISRADSASPGLASPIDVPAAAPVVRSFWVIQRAEITVVDVGVKNLVWYTDGASGWITDLGGAAGAMTIMVATTGTYRAPAASELNLTSYPELDAAPVAAFTKILASPLAMGDGPFLSLGNIGKYVVYQVTVDVPAKVGLVNPERATWKWDNP